MDRAAVLLAVVALLAPALAAGGAAADRAEGVTYQHYDDDGNLVAVVWARKLSPVEGNPKLLAATDLRITYHQDGKKHVATGRTGRVDTEGSSASLQGKVVITFDDRSAVRVETEELHWFGRLGVATTEAPDAKTLEAAAASATPARALEPLVAASKTPVRISSLTATIDGYGLLLTVGGLGGARKEKGKEKEKQRDRTGRLLLGHRIRTEIRGGRADWLLGGDEAQPETPKVEAKAPAKPQAPIIITCRGPLVIHRADLSAVYRGSVRVAQGQQGLTCDTLTVAFATETDPATKRSRAVLDSVTAHGSVSIDNGRDLAVADTATWHQRDGFAMLVGRPARVTWDDGNELAAGRIRRKQNGPKVEWLDCSGTPDYRHTVYLYALAPAGAGLPEKPDAPPKAPEDR